MAKLNCWEYKKCGRQSGGAKVIEFGVCSASSEKSTDGINSGVNGGRACWAIAGTLRGGGVQGTFVAQSGTCLNCDFYKLVLSEEGAHYENSNKIMGKMKKK